MAYTTIKKPSSYFNTKLYTGDGATSNAITGVGFQADFVWLKSRSIVRDHVLTDSVRGIASQIHSNTNEAQTTYTNDVKSFDSDGFTVGTDSDVNSNGATYASWNWLANGTGVANTDGTISSTVSASTTSGFSIVSYTGTATNATVGHGLGVTPQVVIVKNLVSSGASAEHWRVQHHKVSASKVLYLNLTNAEDNNGDFQSTYPTSSYFSISSADGCNKNGEEHIAYCFAEKQGFSKFGSYTGNGNADGPFIYTGFKPAFLIVKNINAAEAWGMHDNKRPGLGNGNAPVGHFELQPNLSNVENSAGAAGQIDFLSNGFKLRTATNSLNVTQNYIYMAFASEPLVGDNPATAR